MTDEELIAELRATSEWSTSPLTLDLAADRLQSLLTQNQKMREALEPFAFFLEMHHKDTDPDYETVAWYGQNPRLTVKSLRDARAALGFTPATPADEAEPLPKATIEDPKIVYHWGHQRIDYSCAPHFRIVFDE